MNSVLVQYIYEISKKKIAKAFELSPFSHKHYKTNIPKSRQFILQNMYVETKVLRRLKYFIFCFTIKIATTDIMLFSIYRVHL